MSALQKSTQLNMNNLKHPFLYSISAATTALLFLTEPCPAETPKTVLVVSETEGYRHSCIETANQVFAQLALTNGDFTVDFAGTRQDLTNKMSASALSNYDGIVFQNTSGDLPLPDINAFLAWIASGKGFMAVHAGIAGSTLPSYPAYADMLGAETLSHTAVQQVQVFNRDSQNAASRHFATSFQWTDEIWLFQNMHANEVHELLGMNQDPSTGVPGDYPLVWCKTYGGGRVLATALGHTQDVWLSTAFQQHVLGGIRWMLKLDRGGLPRLVVGQPAFSGGSFAFHFDGVAVETYQVQASSNLVDWSSISTNTALSNTTYHILDTGAGAFSRRFYRVVLP